MTFQEFVIERRAGAAKIAEECRAKGGLALLTAVHFEAKDQAYRVVLTVADKPTATAAVIKQLRTLDDAAAMSLNTIAKEPPLETFLTLTGKQEVYGECLAFLFDPQSVNRLGNVTAAAEVE